MSKFRCFSSELKLIAKYISSWDPESEVCQNLDPYYLFCTDCIRTNPLSGLWIQVVLGALALQEGKVNDVDLDLNSCVSDNVVWKY